MLIVLGSQSEIKRNALRGALLRANRPEVRTAFYKARSGINEQPFGADMMALGAMNRAQYVVNSDARYDLAYAIGVESGLEFVLGEWIDRSAVVVLDQGGRKVAFTMSLGIPFPEEAVRRCLDAGPVVHTAGQFMRHSHGGSAQDGTATLTKGRLTRESVLTDAIYAAFCMMPGFVLATFPTPEPHL